MWSIGKTPSPLSIPALRYASGGWIRYTGFGSGARSVSQCLLKRRVDNPGGAQRCRQRFDFEQDVGGALQIRCRFRVDGADSHVRLTQPVARDLLIEIGFLRPQIGVFIRVAVDPGPRLLQAPENIRDGCSAPVADCSGTEPTP